MTTSEDEAAQFLAAELAAGRTVAEVAEVVSVSLDDVFRRRYEQRVRNDAAVFVEILRAAGESDDEIRRRAAEENRALVAELGDSLGVRAYAASWRACVSRLLENAV